jgi:hypothetical protein
MAAASHRVTRDRLIWTADAHIRPETYKAALARVIDPHHALLIAMIWGDGSQAAPQRCAGGLKTPGRGTDDPNRVHDNCQRTWPSPALTASKLLPFSKW